MALETGTYISDLVITNPAGADGKDRGDDHIRLLKSTIKTTFPNVTGAVNPTHVEFNYLAGVTSLVQTQLNTLTSAKAAKAGDTYTGTHDFTGAAMTVATPSVAANPATKAYADGLAFATALPLQTGNRGKEIITNGTTASWSLSPASALYINANFNGL